MYVCTLSMPSGCLIGLERANITAVYCHVKSNKVCGKCQVFLEAGSLFHMSSFFFPFNFSRKLLLFYSKNKGGKMGKITPFFVDSLICLSVVPAAGLD